jgi:hypothetical protein
MKNQDIFELIESYLDDTQSGEERKIFEKRMAEDKDFYHEVELHRELQEHFSDSGRWRLRSVLTDILEEPLPDGALTSGENPFVSEPDSQTSQDGKALIITGSQEEKPGSKIITLRRALAIAATLLVLVTAVFWLLQKPAPKEDLVIENAKTAPKENANPPVEKPADTVKPAQKSPPPEAPPQKPPKKEYRFIAEANPADFIPSNSMEVFLDSGGRHRGLRGLTLHLKSPANDDDFDLRKGGEAIVPFAGTVESESKEANFELVLLIVNNREVNNPLKSIPLKLKQSTPGEFTFNARQGLKLSPGLYYFTIELQDGSGTLYTGKFTIGKRYL